MAGAGGSPAPPPERAEKSRRFARNRMAGPLLTIQCVSAPRIVLPNSTVLVTRRTVRRYHLFSPDPAVRNLVVYALAVCADKFDILVHAVVLMSTHLHFVVTDTYGVLPDFLRELHRLIALGTKVLRKWEGPVWDHEKTSVVRLLTPEAILEKIAYCMANPVAAGLVRRACDWPGLTTGPSELGAWTLSATRPSVFFDTDNPQWPEHASLVLTVPPSLVGQMTLQEFRRRVTEELGQLEGEARQELKRQGRGFMGAERCRKNSPYRRARSFERLRGTNPTFAVGRGNREAFFAAVADLRAFRQAYRLAMRQWRAGVRDVPFPPGTWWMRRAHAAAVEPLAIAA